MPCVAYRMASHNFYFLKALSVDEILFILVQGDGQASWHSKVLQTLALCPQFLSEQTRSIKQVSSQDRVCFWFWGEQGSKMEAFASFEEAGRFKGREQGEGLVGRMQGCLEREGNLGVLGLNTFTMTVTNLDAQT